MGVRHDLTSREHFAKMAGVQGDAAVAQVAGVEVPTVGGWRRQFGVAASGPIDASSLPRLDALSLVPTKDQEHELVVAAAALEQRAPSENDSDRWREHRDEFLRHFRAYLASDAPVGAQVHHARHMVDATYAMMRDIPKGMGEFCQSLIVDAEMELMSIEHAAGIREDD